MLRNHWHYMTGICTFTAFAHIVGDTEKVEGPRIFRVFAKFDQASLLLRKLQTGFRQSFLK